MTPGSIWSRARPWPLTPAGLRPRCWMWSWPTCPWPCWTFPPPATCPMCWRCPTVFYRHEGATARAGAAGERAWTCRLAGKSCLAGDGDRRIRLCRAPGSRAASGIRGTWPFTAWSRPRPSTACACRPSASARPGTRVGKPLPPAARVRLCGFQKQIILKRRGAFIHRCLRVWKRPSPNNRDGPFYASVSVGCYESGAGAPGRARGRRTALWAGVDCGEAPPRSCWSRACPLKKAHCFFGLPGLAAAGQGSGPVPAGQPRVGGSSADFPRPLV